MKENRPADGLKGPKNALALLDMYYLDLRSHLLEVAAGLDRIARADRGGEALADPRCVQLIRALELLSRPGRDRARRFLELFSEA